MYKEKPAWQLSQLLLELSFPKQTSFCRSMIKTQRREARAQKRLAGLLNRTIMKRQCTPSLDLTI